MGQADTQELLRYVVGWQGVQEIHLVPGGSAVDVPWTDEVGREFLADRPDLWAPIVDAVLATYTEHVAALDDAAKN